MRCWWVEVAKTWRLAFGHFAVYAPVGVGIYIQYVVVKMECEKVGLSVGIRLSRVHIPFRELHVHAGGDWQRHSGRCSNRLSGSTATLWFGIALSVM